MDSITQLATTLILAITTGGALAYLLDDLPFWKNWTSQPRLKLAATIGLNAFAVFLIVLLQNYAPAFIDKIPIEYRVALLATALYLSNQISHQWDQRLSRG